MFKCLGCSDLCSFESFDDITLCQKQDDGDWCDQLIVQLPYTLNNVDTVTLNKLLTYLFDIGIINSKREGKRLYESGSIKILDITPTYIGFRIGKLRQFKLRYPVKED